MAKPKKKLLPKDFDALLKIGELSALKSVFDTCDLDARGGYSKRTALAFPDCPDELARWLVEQGASIEAEDTYERTPLHSRAANPRGKVAVLLELGANVQATDRYRDTPLHHAVKSANVEAVRNLLANGADAEALNLSRLTPLAAGLQQCSNIKIEPMTKISELLVRKEEPKNPGLGGLLSRTLSRKPRQSGPVDPQLKEYVRQIGANFEFHRSGSNPEYREATSAALGRLYALFDVPAVPLRVMHNEKDPIIAKSQKWQDQHQELWELLVPPHGPASTRQGEVIRISGRISDEIDRNGGNNWDADYKKIGKAFLDHIASGAPLPDNERAIAAKAIAEVRRQDGAGAELCRLATQWVTLNPVPLPLSPPDYLR